MSILTDIDHALIYARTAFHEGYLQREQRFFGHLTPDASYDAYATAVLAMIETMHTELETQPLKEILVDYYTILSTHMHKYISHQRQPPIGESISSTHPVFLDHLLRFLQLYKKKLATASPQEKASIFAMCEFFRQQSTTPQ
jgi:hypothetical protein